MNKTHEKFMERIIEANREPTLPEKTHDALSDNSQQVNPIIPDGQLKAESRSRLVSGKRSVQGNTAPADVEFMPGDTINMETGEMIKHNTEINLEKDKDE